VAGRPLDVAPVYRAVGQLAAGGTWPAALALAASMAKQLAALHLQQQLEKQRQERR